MSIVISCPRHLSTKDPVDKIHKGFIKKDMVNSTIKSKHTISNTICFTDRFHHKLSEEGIEYAKELAKRYKTCGVTKIYSSPYYSTLETVSYFCEESRLPVNVENALYEAQIYDTDVEQEVKNRLHYFSEHEHHSNPKKNVNHVMKHVNKYYKSRLIVSNIKKNETISDINGRVCSFLYRICNSIEQGDKILLMTHENMIPHIRKYILENQYIKTIDLIIV